MATADDKEQRLRDAAIISEGTELPKEYAAVVAGLTPDELEVLVAVKERLDEAERVSGKPAGDTFVAP